MSADAPYSRLAEQARASLIAKRRPIFSRLPRRYRLPGRNPRALLDDADYLILLALRQMMKQGQNDSLARQTLSDRELVAAKDARISRLEMRRHESAPWRNAALHHSAHEIVAGDGEVIGKRDPERLEVGRAVGWI